MDLKCKKLNCKYNNKYACVAKGIDVTKTIKCATYDKTDDLPPEQLQDISKTMFTDVPDIHPYRHSKKIKINCDAKCLFNQGGICVANGITVGNEKTCAKCYTYAKP